MNKAIAIIVMDELIQTAIEKAPAIAHDRRIAPDKAVAAEPPPRLGIPAMIAAAKTKVAASAMNRTLADLGTSVRMAPAIAKPIAAHSIVVAPIRAFALPT